LPALIDVVVLIDGRIVPLKDELVGMTAVAQVELRLLAQVLLQPGKP